MLLVGVARIGNDPALRTTAQGKPVMDISLAFQYGRKGDDGKHPTTWVKGSLWGDRCEKLQPYLAKGQQIYVQLSDIHINSYDKKDGSGTATELRGRIDTLEFVGEAKKKDDAAQKPVKQETPSIDELDDDIPF